MTRRWPSKVPRFFWILPAAAGLLVCACSRMGTGSGGGVFDSISGEVQEVFDRVAPAVVKVRNEDVFRPLAGTGFFIDEAGTVLTSYSVVREDGSARVEHGGVWLRAKVVGRDARTNLALLKMEKPLRTPCLKFGDSDDLSVASGVIGVAYPFNLPLSPNFGFVTGFDVRYLNNYFATTHIRSSVLLSPGQIGGPLLNSRAEVVGVLVLAVQDGNECYALPSRSAERVIAELRDGGRMRHGWCGVGVVEKAGESQPRVVVNNLFEGTPAAASGLRMGDEVLRIGRREIHRPSDILDASFFASVGEDMPVTVIRNGQEMTFRLTVAEREAGNSAVRGRVVPESSNRRQSLPARAD
jgi:serine protease Do